MREEGIRLAVLPTGVSEPRRTIHYATTKLPRQTRLATSVPKAPRRNAGHSISGWKVVGLTRFELVTPRLSSVCSNQLSYRPDSAKASSGKPSSPDSCGIPPQGLSRCVDRLSKNSRHPLGDGRFSQN